MRANGGKCEQILAPANHKETLVAKTRVNPIGGEVRGWTGIDDSSYVFDGSVPLVRGRAASGHGRG